LFFCAGETPRATPVFPTRIRRRTLAEPDGTTWVQGDYDYNGSITLDDFPLFLGGYQQRGAQL
jgi:hypothetical protein